MSINSDLEPCRSADMPGHRNGVARPVPALLAHAVDVPFVSSPPEHLVNRAVTQRHHEQIAVRTRVDIRPDAEVPPEQ
jgi:hypothetical protein